MAVTVKNFAVVQLPVKDLEASVEKGIDTGELIYKKGGGYSFTLRDPDGHLSNLWGGWPSAEEGEVDS